MMINADCTLYKYQNSTGGYTRHVVKDVYWEEGAAAAVGKSGVNSADRLSVFFYSADALPETPTKDLLVKGVADFVFDNTSPQTISESLKAFQKQHSVFVVTAVHDYMYGGLPHVEISAR